ncbi:MAG: PilC/PilY family type IV pilus protein, partial [Steroidobacteraceae bacterium]|nr:PilC/PilY family type IV pilus protein [Steroidobacteraceae bacterium]
ANQDSIADYVYAGDLFGNLWKFNITHTNPSNWDVAYQVSGDPAPFYVARTASGVRQPITARPTVGRGPTGTKLQVYVGTGKFLELQDRFAANIVPATFYGLIDNNTGSNSDIISGRSLLTQQTITGESTVTLNGVTNMVRTTSSNPMIAPNNRGWYIDLISPANGFEGEMAITNPVLRNERIIFTTLIPNPDPCGFGGVSWLMILQARNGARADSTFDLNGDANLTNDDRVPPPSGTENIAASGVRSGTGIWSAPTPLTNGANDVLIMSNTGTADQDDSNNRLVDPGPGGMGRQSWRQLR